MIRRSSRFKIPHPIRRRIDRSKDRTSVDINREAIVVTSGERQRSHCCRIADFKGNANIDRRVFLIQNILHVSTFSDEDIERITRLGRRKSNSHSSLTPGALIEGNSIPWVQTPNIIRGIARNMESKWRITTHQLQGFATRSSHAIRDIRILPGKHWRELRLHRRSIRSEQCQVFPGGTQLKIRMQLRSGIGSILTRGKNQEFLSRGQDDGWNHPSIRLDRIIAQRPSRQINRCTRNIRQLDPIGIFAILVFNP